MLPCGWAQEIYNEDMENPDFQTDPAKNYPRDKPNEANMAICASQITARFNCFAATLEQPFIDTESEFKDLLLNLSEVLILIISYLLYAVKFV